MSETAEALSAMQSSRRNVTIEISNMTKFCLLHPKVYLDSGYVHCPPSPSVRYMRTELCNFSKIPTTATGTVGVLTYDVVCISGGAPDRIAIMFSVPFDQVTYKNWYALGIYTKDKECDKALYEEMYNKKEEQSDFLRKLADGCVLTFTGKNVELYATMSPMGRAIVKLEVWDKVFQRQTSH